MSCLVVVLCFVFIFGNVFLFSGSLWNDLEGNPFAILMGLVSIIADFILFGWIILSIANRIRQIRQRKLQENSNAIKTEIDRIITRYSYPDILIMSSPSQKDEFELLQPNEKIIRSVNQYREETTNIRSNLAELLMHNNAILSCPECCSDDQRISFLRKQTTRLEELKRTIVALNSEYSKHRITLPDDDDGAIFLLRNALTILQNSKIIKEDGAISLHEFLNNSKLPIELYFFKFSTPPICMSFKSFTLYLFPKTILVFREGNYISAITPNELNIIGTPVEKSVKYSDGKYISDIVDVDSKCVQVGTTIKTCMHVCKDGTPDLRYSYNPSIEYRIDRMIHGKVIFEIAGFRTAFIFSSHKALEEIGKASRLYCCLDKSFLHNKELVSYEHDLGHIFKANEPIDNSQFLITQEKDPYNFNQKDKIVAKFDALFSKCLTPQEIIREYAASVESQELIDPTNIERLFSYLQTHSKFTSFNWTIEYIQDLLSEQIKRSINISQKKLDENINKEQLTSPISERNKGEFTTAFAEFHVTQEDETVELGYSPQKINYQLSNIKKTLSKEPYKRFKRMRGVRAQQSSEFSVNGIVISISGNDSASQFVAQAKFMETFEDNYENHADFKCYYSTYMDMNDEQLRTYFSWRTKVRKGQVEATDLSYAFVYIYELLNLIGVSSADEGMRHLLTFWSSFRSYNDKIDQYLTRWVKDFYIYYRLKCSYKRVLDQYPEGVLKESFAQEEIYRHNYQNKIDYLNQLSSYKYLKSRYFESELGYTLIECIPLVLTRVDAYLGEHGISFPTLLLGSIITDKWWRPFSRAVVDVKTPSGSFIVKINENEEYSFANGKWQSKEPQRRYYSNLLGYIIKTTEAELRELTGFKWKLKPNIKSITNDYLKDKQALRLVNNPEFTEVIRDVVKTYFSSSGICPQVYKLVAQDDDIPIKPVEVNVDKSKLEAIRYAANEIQDRLVIDEGEDGLIQNGAATAIEEMDVITASIIGEQEKNASSQGQEIALTELQRICISIITSGQNVNSRIKALSIANGTLPEVLIEYINELLYEYFGDNVIDSAADVPYIYNDYLNDVKEIIKEN